MSQGQRYTDAHRFIAQKFLIFGPSYRKDINRFIAEAAKSTKVELGNGDQDLVHIFQVINAKMAPLNLRIQRTPNEISGTWCYVLVNNNIKELVDWKTEYSDKEIDFISKTFSGIAKNDMRELTRHDVHKIAAACKIANTDCDRILEGLADSSYFMKYPHPETNEDIFAFGVRVVAELYEYMAAQYTDALPECGSCKRLVFNRGETIDCHSCETSTTFHTGCKKKANAGPAQQSQKAHTGLTCPSCRTSLILA